MLALVYVTFDLSFFAFSATRSKTERKSSREKKRREEQNCFLLSLRCQIPSLIYFGLREAPTRVICVHLRYMICDALGVLEDLPPLRTALFYYYLTPFSVRVPGTGSRASGPTLFYYCFYPLVRLLLWWNRDSGVCAEHWSLGPYRRTAGTWPSKKTMPSCPTPSTQRCKYQDKMPIKTKNIFLPLTIYFPFGFGAFALLE